MQSARLRNGIRVVVEPIPTYRSISVGLWVKTGSRNEQDKTNGISHFIEHMLFKGTDQLDARAIAIAFDSIGSTINACTAKEYTCYYVKVLDKQLPLALQVLSQMFLHSSLQEEQLYKERQVIWEEIAMYEDTPDDAVHDLVMRAAFGTHPLALPILGTKDQLSSMNSEHLRTYMNRHYTVANIVIAVAGNVDDTLFELLDNQFGHFKNEQQTSVLTAPQFCSEWVYHHKQTEQNHLCLSLPGCSLTDSYLYPLILLTNIIGGGMSSRLFQTIREQKGLAYSVYAYHSAYTDSGLFTIYAGTAPQQTEQVLANITELLGELAVNGLTDEELHISKEQLKGNIILGLESTTNRMNELGKNELLLGKHYTIHELTTYIDEISKQQLLTVLQRMIAQPFACALIGADDQGISTFRRDQLVTTSTPNIHKTIIR